jgi:hypothetical protein
MAGRDGARAPRRPDAAQDRFEPDAVRVGREGLDHRTGMALRLFGDDLGELSSNLACSSRRRRAGVARPRPLDRPADRPERLPAALLGHRSQPELGRHLP